MMTQSTSDSALASGRDALARCAWDEAFREFRRALDERETAEAHECLSWAAWWRNDADTMFRSRETAYRLYRQAGDDRGAARMAMWLGADHADFRGELSVASGWRQRARRLLENLPLSREHGWERLLAGDAALMFEGDLPTARRCADEVLEIGRRLGVTEFSILPLALQGCALVEEGEMDAGLRLLDEAAVAVLSEELESPLWASWAICYLLFACERARDFDRATEWCARLRELTERCDMHYFVGVCRAHYAAVLIWRGEWRQAEEQLSAASDSLETRVPWAAEARVRLGDLRRRQGRLDEAARLFAEAEWHPLSLFGQGELALDAGRPKDAQECLERALRQTPEHSRHQRAVGLELLVRAESLLGRHSRAASTLRELQELSGSISPTPPLRAASEYTAGIVALAAGDYENARRHLEDSITLFERGGAPYEVARARLELASALVSLGRLERARDEAAAARATLTRLGSGLYSRRAAALCRDIERRQKERGAADGDGGRAPLTRRQVQILRLIAHGKSDREIAATLRVSEHTVHRHVANILSRLGTPTRAAAAALAASRDLI